MEDFETLVARAERTGATADVVALLRQARLQRVADTHAETIIKWGKHALSRCRSALGDEL